MGSLLEIGGRRSASRMGTKCEITRAFVVVRFLSSPLNNLSFQSFFAFLANCFGRLVGPCVVAYPGPWHRYLIF